MLLSFGEGSKDPFVLGVLGICGVARSGEIVPVR